MANWSNNLNWRATVLTIQSYDLGWAAVLGPWLHEPLAAQAAVKLHCGHAWATTARHMPKRLFACPHSHSTVWASGSACSSSRAEGRGQGRNESDLLRSRRDWLRRPWASSSSAAEGKIRWSQLGAGIDGGHGRDHRSGVEASSWGCPEILVEIGGCGRGRAYWALHVRASAEPWAGAPTAGDYGWARRCGVGLWAWGWPEMLRLVIGVSLTSGTHNNTIFATNYLSIPNTCFYSTNKNIIYQ